MIFFFYNPGNCNYSTSSTRQQKKHGPLVHVLFVVLGPDGVGAGGDVGTCLEPFTSTRVVTATVTVIVLSNLF